MLKKLNFEKVGYEILEESISLYIGFSNKCGHYNIITIIGRKSRNNKTIEEYLKSSNENFGYKII